MRADTGDVVALALQPPVGETVLRITEHSDGDISYIEGTGEIDLEGERLLRHAMEQAIARGSHSVIFDLRDVTYMDTGALKILLEAKSRVIGLGGEVYVVVDESLPKRVIYMASLQSALGVCGSLDEVFAEIARRATPGTAEGEITVSAPAARLRETGSCPRPPAE